MRVCIRRTAVLLTSLSTLLLSVGPLGRPASALGRDTLPSQATVTGPDCAVNGNTDTLSWTPVAGAVGYQIQGTDYDPYAFPPNSVYNVPATQTSIQVPVVILGVGFTIFALEPDIPPITPPPPPPYPTIMVEIAQVIAPGIGAPQPMPWDIDRIAGPTVAGDGFVTISFAWSAESLFFYSGDTADQVTVTASPGGQSITSTAVVTTNGAGVSDTFTGLTDGTTYTFSAEVTNICGSAGPTTWSLTPEAPPPLFTCTVTSTEYPPAVKRAKQIVTVQSSDGLAAINDISVVNGIVTVAPFTSGTTVPVTVTAIKKNQSKPTSWSFEVTDVDNNTQLCS